MKIEKNILRRINKIKQIYEPSFFVKMVFEKMSFFRRSLTNRQN